MPDYFKLYRTMFDTGMNLKDPEMRATYFEALCRYGLDGVIPTDSVPLALITGAMRSIDKSNAIATANSKKGKKHKGNQYTQCDTKRKGTQKAQKKAMEQIGTDWNKLEQNGTEDINSNIHSNISSYEDIYSLYYKGGTGIDSKKCDPLLDGLLARGITLDDIRKGVVLYNSICRIRGSDGFRYVKNFDTWLREYHKPTEDQLEETLTTVIGMHKEKGKTDSKYKDSKRASVLWKELCDTFGKEKVNDIFKREGSGPSIKFT